MLHSDKATRKHDVDTVLASGFINAIHAFWSLFLVIIVKNQKCKLLETPIVIGQNQYITNTKNAFILFRVPSSAPKEVPYFRRFSPDLGCFFCFLSSFFVKYLKHFCAGPRSNHRHNSVRPRLQFALHAHKYSALCWFVSAPE